MIYWLMMSGDAAHLMGAISGEPIQAENKREKTKKTKRIKDVSPSSKDERNLLEM
jgi:hypothetical protein